ncbi:ricin-type beta-trefoil lectin domain protein [Dactylosporangium sp. NPDC051541]|uniref:ricin-type beta-trefoil lectin domain protein n=1 Tax=Dactylosporangium sp. NPDC051541 TaxID=3363977 RepID=UPI0037A1A409
MRAVSLTTALTVAAATVLTAVLSSATPASAATTTIALNGGITGRTFDGVGAISGGGGNSRLLVDYPEPQRGQILDYLFKPNYGAAVQLLKLEIGGDANSTDGAEPSHEHVRGDVNCNVGYEFWLGEQALARNPNLRIVALPWAAPGWIGNGNFWSQDMIDYDIAWLNCAKGHGITVHYLGGWNERGHDSGWYKSLRTSLNNAGFGAVQIVGDDSGWGMADEFAGDPALKSAVGVLGNHYVCGYLSAADSCSTTANARSSGKPLWASEFGSQDDMAGVVPYIRTVNRGYLDAEISGYMNWPLIAAITPNLPYATVGLMDAGSPWSGAYRIGRNLWANAHYAQFTAPGWKYLNSSASGYLGGNRANGSYVSLKSTNNTDYTTVYETSGTTSTQTVNVTVSGDLSPGAVHVWTTDMGSTNPNDWFVHQPDIVPSGSGTYSLTMQPNRIYTLSTTSGQAKGTAASPAGHALALPYSDTFDGYAVRKQPRYTEDMQGSFETRTCAGGRTGTCLQQVAPQRPINWQDDSDAYTLIGDPAWTNYTVSLDVNLQQAGTITLLGRANVQQRPQNRQAAYQLRVSETGAWSIVKHDTGNANTTLTSGTRSALGLNSWHNLRLGFSGAQITATIDGTVVGTANDFSYGSGQAGVGVIGYQTDQFDNLNVTANAGPVLSVLRGAESGRCADVPALSQTNGTQLALWDCNGGANQTFLQTASNQLQVYGNKCLDVDGASTADGAKVQIWDCNNGGNQQWTVNPDGTVVGAGSGKCLDATAHGTANGTLLEIWTCTGGDNQRWSRN